MVFNYKIINQITLPATEPLTLAEVKNYLRVDDTIDDNVLTELITSVRILVETYLKKRLITQQISIQFQCLYQKIDLPAIPLQSVDSFTYVDSDGSTHGYANTNYRVLNDYIYILDSAQNPSNLDEWLPWTIEYTVGYGDTAADVPDGIKQAMLKMIKLMYEDGAGCECIGLVESLLTPYIDARYLIV